MNKYEALDYIRESDVEFIRLQFCDMFGRLKNMSIMAWQLERAFEYGIPFDASCVTGLLNTDNEDLFLMPDADTLSVLPWRPQTGRVVRFYCDIKHSDGTVFGGDGRNLLKNTVEKFGDYEVKIGNAIEFMLFNTDEEGNPTFTPHDSANYFEPSPADRGENVRRNICLTLKEMGISVEGSHHEAEHGQHEIIIMHEDALRAADNFVTAKSVISTVAHQNGLYASFMPKPFENIAGNGTHINISIYQNGRNIFAGDDISEDGKYFIAGIMANTDGICLFSNPTVNSYKRLMSGSRAPKYIAWSKRNIPQLVSIPKSNGNSAEIEIRNPDGTMSPYVTYALLTESGMWGIKNKIKLQKEFDKITSKTRKLPSNLHDAIVCAENNMLVKNVLGEKVFNEYAAIKQHEWEDYQNTVTDWELKKYF